MSDVCPVCHGEQWVCENHRDRPWNKNLPGGCTCGAGVPCPRCNTFPDESAPDVSGVIETVDLIDEDKVKRRLN